MEYWHELIRGFGDYKYFSLIPSEFKRKKLQLLDKIRRL